MLINPRWSLRVTHTPSGIVVIRDSNHFRNQHLARDAAIQYLKSRLHYTNIVVEDVKFEYNLPDNYLCPVELGDYKQKMAEIAKISQELGLMGD